ncbi:hypothetical protein Acr_25g0006150 [Actinidia rufa]|uniref:Uncharacterized protein n=1 Tax=Actinidia rufa TaxID=165716 RepID=A0A7J0GZI2_9ERIC|nr:hypothetical protein Acr_25g0006150 [Actinidia rufa]
MRKKNRNWDLNHMSWGNLIEGKTETAKKSWASAWDNTGTVLCYWGCGWLAVREADGCTEAIAWWMVVGCTGTTQGCIGAAGDWLLVGCIGAAQGWRLVVGGEGCTGVAGGWL